MLETYPRRPWAELFPHVGDAAAVERSLDLDEGVAKIIKNAGVVIPSPWDSATGELTEVF